MSMFRGVSALALMYRLVNVERVLGTSRFSALLLVATLVAGVAVVSASASTGFALEGAEPGPLAVLGAMAGIFGAAMRPSTRAEQLRIGGLPITDKTVTMALALWVALGAGFSSFIPALAGFGTGALFASGALPPFSRLAMPSFIRSACGATLGRILGSPQPGALEAAVRRTAGVRRIGVPPRGAAAGPAGLVAQPGGGDARRRGGGPAAAAAARGAGGPAAAAMGGAGGGGVAPAAAGRGRAGSGSEEDDGHAAAFARIPRVDADPAMVAQLVEMGFGEDQARGALRRSLNNLEHAAAALLQ